MSSPPLPAVATPKLIVVAGVFSGEVFPLDGPAVSFGRQPTNAICFPDPALSRRHCEFVRADTHWRVRDLSSANGTFVNGMQVTEQALAEGDRIGLGDSVLLYVSGISQTASPVAEAAPEHPFSATRKLAIADAAYLQREPEAGDADPPLARGLRTLLTISSLIHSIRHEQDLHRELLELLFDAVPADRGAVIIVGDTGDLTTAATRAVKPGETVQIGFTAVRTALSDGVGILGREAASQEPGARPPNSGSTERGSFLAVPIAVRGTGLGAIYLTSSGGRGAGFTEDHLELVTAVARIASIALDNVRHVAVLEKETERLQADLQLTHNMIGESPAVRRVYDRVARIARSESTVLIVGETGTGKEMAARALHLNGARARRPFVAINCAALGEHLLESELFGHERGAFTGAVVLKKGKLEVADGGTMFLDEIGELAPALQSRLLRVLQEREFERVGGTRPIKVDIRLISATNRTLAAEVAAGRFREDLYFRLNVVSIEMPPLRERRTDIPLLARYFLQRHARKCGRRIAGFSREAMACLTAYDWPGNVRELENAIERAVVLGTGAQVEVEDLPDTVIDAAPGPQAEQPGNIHRVVLEAKKRAILDAFRKSNGSYTDTARLLGVHPNYLHRLIRNLGIKPQLEAEP